MSFFAGFAVFLAWSFDSYQKQKGKQPSEFSAG